MIRILYSSNSFWSMSGYGVQGKSLLPRLAELPEIDGRQAVAQFAWYGLQGGVHHVDGFKVYPAGTDPYGNDIIGAHTRNHRANVVISLIDVWVMKGTAAAIAPAVWLPWLPVDHDPVPQKVLEALEGAYIPLTYAKWGHKMLKDAGIDNVYIPHGLEPSVYRILDADIVAQFRREVLMNPEHLTVMVAANKGYPDRKGFQFQVRAWAEFAKDKPGARLYIHTEPTPMYGGIDFAALLDNLGIKSKVIFPDRYNYFIGYPAEYMALLYNAADVFLGASMAEGFGIPLIEAQACGTPVVTLGATSMPELVRWGHIVSPADRWWTPLNSWQFIPDVRGLTDALQTLHAENPGGAKPWAAAEVAQDAIHAEYSWDNIVRDYWAPLMRRLAGDMAYPAMELPHVQSMREAVAA